MDKRVIDPASCFFRSVRGKQILRNGMRFARDKRADRERKDHTYAPVPMEERIPVCDVKGCEIDV